MRWMAGAALVLLAACGGGAPAPRAVDPLNDACAWCRMTVSDPRFAGQVVAPGEEPVLFDDLGCLRDWLRENATGADARAFVADHRTRDWVPAPQATVTSVPGLATPMASGLLAHAGPASRDADPDARGGTPVEASTLFGGTR